MSYAFLGLRKMMLISQISDIEFLVTNLMMKMQSLSNQSAIIADGVITDDEKASIFDYGTLKGLNAIEQSGFARKLAKQKVYDSVRTQQGKVKKRMTTLAEEYREEMNNRIHLTEKNLQMQMKRLETQLSAKRKELESVTQAEKNAIKQSTSNFGLN